MYLARAQGRNDTLAATEIGPAESDVEGVCPGHLAIMVTRCNHKGGASSIPPKHQVGVLQQQSCKGLSSPTRARKKGGTSPARRE